MTNEFRPRPATTRGRSTVVTKISKWRHSQIKAMAKDNQLSVDELMRQIIEFALGEEPHTETEPTQAESTEPNAEEN